MHPTLSRFRDEENGEDLIEYSLLVAFAAGVALVAIVADPLSVKAALLNAWQRVKTALTGN